MFPEVLHLFQGLFLDGFQGVPVVLDAILVLKGLPEFLAFLDVFLVEDVPSEVLDFVRHLPLLVFLDAFFDVVQ